MNKAHILTLLLIVCCFSTSYGQTDKNKYVLLDYDRAYFVDISVDTTLCLNQLPEYKGRKEARYTKAHKVHCDLSYLFLWDSISVSRILIRSKTMIKKDSINIDNINQKMSGWNLFKPTEENLHKELPNRSTEIEYSDTKMKPDFSDYKNLFAEYYEGEYLLQYNDTLYSIKPYDVRFIFSLQGKAKLNRYDFNKKQKNGRFYDYFNNKKDSFETIKQYSELELKPTISAGFAAFESENDTDILTHFLTERFISDYPIYSFPASTIPLNYNKPIYKAYQYFDTIDKINIHSLLQVGSQKMSEVNIETFAINTMYFSRHSKKTFICVPEVFFFQSYKTESETNNRNSSNNIPHFKFKVNSINGKSLNQFLSSYDPKSLREYRKPKERATPKTIISAPAY